ncbi:MAG: hypothetical protein ACLP5H_06680, partial [Desulfomonilaceae bacterium]
MEGDLMREPHITVVLWEPSLSHIHSALDPDRFDTILLFLARPVRCRTGYNVTWYVKIMSFPPSFL